MNYIFSTCSVLLLWVSSLGVFLESALLVFICQSHLSPFYHSLLVFKYSSCSSSISLTLLSVVTVLSCVSVSLGFISGIFFAFNFFFNSLNLFWNFFLIFVIFSIV